MTCSCQCGRYETGEKNTVFVVLFPEVLKLKIAVIALDCNPERTQHLVGKGNPGGMLVGVERNKKEGNDQEAKDNCKLQRF